MRFLIIILFFAVISIAKTEDYIIEFQAKVKNLRTFNISNSEQFRSYDLEGTFTDNYGNSELKNFQENRHDQSILSLLTKSLGGVFVENETFFSPNSENQKSYPFLSVRNYGHGNRDKIKFKLNFKNIKKTPVYF